MSDIVPLAQIICWQEATPEFRARLRRTLSSYTHVTFNDDEFGPGRNPMSFRTADLELLDKGYRRAHEGEEGLTPGRFVCWMTLRHRETGLVLTVYNVHFIDSAWREEIGREPADRTAERRELWLVNRSVLAGELAQLRHPAVVLGDVNRHRWGVVSPGRVVEPQWQGPQKVDRVAHTPGGATHRVTCKEIHIGPRLGSDHESIFALLHFERAA